MFGFRIFSFVYFYDFLALHFANIRVIMELGQIAFGKRIYLPVSSVGASITSLTCTSSAVSCELTRRQTALAYKYCSGHTCGALFLFIFIHILFTIEAVSV